MQPRQEELQTAGLSGLVEVAQQEREEVPVTDQEVTVPGSADLTDHSQQSVQSGQLCSPCPIPNPSQPWKVMRCSTE